MQNVAWEKRNGSMKGKVNDTEVKMESSNTHLIGVLEGEDRENGRDIIFEETVAENFSEMTKRPKSTDLGNTASP